VSKYVGVRRLGWKRMDDCDPYSAGRWYFRMIACSRSSGMAYAVRPSMPVVVLAAHQRIHHGHARAHRPLADDQWSIAVNQCGIPNADTRYIGDGVPGARSQASDGDPQITRPAAIVAKDCSMRTSLMLSASECSQATQVPGTSLARVPRAERAKVPGTRLDAIYRATRPPTSSLSERA